MRRERERFFVSGQVDDDETFIDDLLEQIKNQEME